MDLDSDCGYLWEQDQGPGGGSAPLGGLTGAWSLIQQFGAILRRGAITNRTVRADRIVFAAETPCDALRIEEVGQQFAVQALVAEAVVEVFGDAILPWAAEPDEPDLDTRVRQPMLEVLRNKLRIVVAPQMKRRSVGLPPGMVGRRRPRGCTSVGSRRDQGRCGCIRPVS